MCKWHSLSREYTHVLFGTHVLWNTLPRVNLVLRLPLSPVFARLQCAKIKGERLGLGLGLGYTVSDCKLKAGKASNPGLYLKPLFTYCNSKNCSVKNLLHYVPITSVPSSVWRLEMSICCYIGISSPWMYSSLLVCTSSLFSLICLCLFTGAPWRPHLSKLSTLVSETTAKLPECR